MVCRTNLYRSQVWCLWEVAYTHYCLYETLYKKLHRHISRPYKEIWYKIFTWVEKLRNFYNRVIKLLYFNFFLKTAISVIDNIKTSQISIYNASSAFLLARTLWNKDRVVGGLQSKQD